MHFLLAAGTVAEGVGDAVEEITDSLGWFAQIFEGFPTKAVTFGIKVVIAILMFIVGRRLIKFIVKLIDRSMDRLGTEVSVRKFVRYLSNAIGYIILVILILGVVGIQPTVFATVISSITVALGLALQGSLSNFAGGLLILLLKPFKVGDYVIEDTNKNEGFVKSIGLVYTELTTIDNKTIIVPNGNLANSSMTNVTAQEKRQLDLKVSISYESDLKKAKEVLLALMGKDPLVIQEDPQIVFVSELGESAVILGCRCWTKTENYWNCRWGMTENIKLALDEAGIKIPYNQMDVHIQDAQQG